MKYTNLTVALISFVVVADNMASTTAFFSSVLTSSPARRSGKQQILPDLGNIVEAQHEAVLQIALDIGKSGESSRMGIKGLTLELHSEAVPSDQPSVKLPGINGPHPELSSGSRRLEIQEEGGFVSLGGAQKVGMKDPCWEMVWRDGAPAGSLVCGFDISDDYHRNDATLPKGKTYISFPVWTTEGLADAREQKAKSMGYNQAKRDALDEFQQEPNLLLKALKYREACVAAEKCSLYPMRNFAIVPDAEEIVPFRKHQESADDIWLTTRGVVWATELPRGQKVVLGSANIIQSTFSEQ
mmetsp:Transcript_2644/g.7338  ORF Transcript_2644/g.7338 Transcript_2644/m.7338 type:complete len:298 (-) Transcript_2644:117-1010(-)